jgi:hypothetical protein
MFGIPFEASPCLEPSDGDVSTRCADADVDVSCFVLSGRRRWAYGLMLCMA